ncbi:MAG: hypothetical protein JWN75_239 [Candidatus Saccharibacteria bacterium]|nr:hypothetical protein [Candidatus Saccharibacteria bacterium]
MDTPETASIAATHIKDTSHNKLKIFLVILLAFVASGLAGASLYYWTQNHEQSSLISAKDKQIQTLNAQITTLKKPTLTPTPSTVVNANIISIKELGISFTVPDSLTDLTYSYTSFSSASSKSESVSFSTKAITDKYASTKDCTSYGSAPPLGGISRYEGQNDPKNPHGILIKQFDKFYIEYASPQATCTDNQTSVAAEIKLLKDSLSTIKEISVK